jgi:hypothetical protein
MTDGFAVTVKGYENQTNHDQQLSKALGMLETLPETEDELTAICEG